MIRVPDVVRRAITAAGVLAAGAVILSCGSGEKTLGVADPLAAPPHPTYEQVRVILDRRCLSCHDKGGEGDEGGEDDDPDYSTCAGILADLGGILDTAVLDGSMPPGALPRLTEREKLILTRWIDDGAPSPCTP